MAEEEPSLVRVSVRSAPVPPSDRFCRNLAPPVRRDQPFEAAGQLLDAHNLVESFAPTRLRRRFGAGSCVAAMARPEPARGISGAGRVEEPT